MAAIDRISVRAETSLRPSPEADLVARMHELVTKYGYDTEESVGADMDDIARVHKAGPYYYGQDGEGRRHMFRVVMPRNMVAHDAPVDADDPTRSFTVFRVDHGWLTEELDEIIMEEADFHWLSYVTAVIDHDAPDEPMFFNSQDGRPLDFGDMLDVKDIIEAMAADYRSDLFNAALEEPTEDDVALAYGPADTDEPTQPAYETFKFATLDSCPNCDAANTFCQHRPGLMN